MIRKKSLKEQEGGTSTGSAGLNKPDGQFVKGTLPATGEKVITRKCPSCGFEYKIYSKTTKCPNCYLTRLRTTNP